MNKITLFIGILFFCILFGAVDYYVNIPKEQVAATVIQARDQALPNLTQNLIIDPNPLFEYQIIKRERTTQLFEKFDLSSLKNIQIYRNELRKAKAKDESSSIVVYEIHAKNKQGSLIYLNIKLKFIDQMNDDENLKEIKDFNKNSFFFNDEDSQNTAFLLVQTEDYLFGFQYNKSDKHIFEILKAIIQTI